MNARLGEIARPGQERHGGDIDLGDERLPSEEPHEVAEQTEAGDVGHRACPVRAQRLGRRAVAPEHDGERRLHVRTPCAGAIETGEQRADAERLGQHQRVSRDRRVALRALRRRVPERVDDEPEGQRHPLGRVAADERRALLGERRDDALHELPELAPGDAFVGGRQRREHLYRLHPHRLGDDVAQRVQRGDASEGPGVVDDRVELIDRLHERSPARVEHGRVSRLRDAREHVGARLDRERPEHLVEQRAADLGTAAAAAHAVRCGG